MSVRVAAVDLGAGSGRVTTAIVGPDTLALTEVARFPNVPDADGKLLGNPVHYRDTRTDGVIDEVLSQVREPGSTIGVCVPTSGWAPLP